MTVYEDPTAGMTDEQKAIYDIALAYYDKAYMVQYCDRQMTYLGTDGAMRSNDWVTAEMATNQSVLYSMCSKYIYEIFAEAFVDANGEPYHFCGLEPRKYFTYYLIRLAWPDSEYYNSDVLVDFWRNPGQKREVIRERILDELQIGDVLIYKKLDGSGHTVLYLGNDVIINVTAHRRENGSFGGSYDYRNKKDRTEPAGAVGITSLREDVLSAPDPALVSVSKYVLDDSITDLAILRPLNEIYNGNYQISCAARCRRALSRLSMEKTASAGMYDSVNPGESIKYTICLTGCAEGKHFQTLKVTDRIPEHTSLLECSDGCIVNGAEISWMIDVSACETRSVWFTVRVDAERNTWIESSQGAVNNLPLRPIRTLVANTLTPERKKEIYKTVTAMNGIACSGPEKLINSIYENKIELPNAENLFAALCDSFMVQLSDCESNCLRSGGDTGEKLVYMLESTRQKAAHPLHALMVPGFFGGVYFTRNTDPLYYDGRIKCVVESALTAGDVVAVYDDDAKTEYMLYLYLGQSTFATVVNGMVKLLQSKDAAALVDSLIGCNGFFALRPSFLV